MGKEQESSGGLLGGCLGIVRDVVLRLGVKTLLEEQQAIDAVNDPKRAHFWGAIVEHGKRRQWW